MDNLSGQILKGYELRESIGAGGFGAVYRAFQTVVQREVAIKVILPQYANQPEFIRNFEVEAQIIARLEHLHIIPLFDYWREPDGAYLVMRYLRGGSLTSRLKQKKLNQELTLNIIDQITSALAAAHRAGVIHRDLKPDNILLDEDDNAYLTDFGIAKITGQEATNDNISGTLAYMSPEQLMSAPPTPQADLYSLGVVIFELLAGKHPFDGSSPSQMMMNHINEPLPDIRSVRADLPAEVDDVIQKATAKAPEDRYTDARQIAAALRTAFRQGSDIIASGSSTFIDPSEIINPYKGLRAFQEADSADFFGRELLVSYLLDRMVEDSPYSRFMAVVGPSGSGKSSVVRAGLVPSLRRGGLPGSDNWFIVDMVPGTNPLRQLEAALLSIALRPPARMFDMLKSNESGLLWAVDLVMADVDGDLLIIIDQFEEVFTMMDNEEERLHFLNLIRVAVEEPGSRLRVIITMRADFTDRPLEYVEFGELIRRRTEFILPMSADEIERAITGPATRVGLQVDTDLIVAIVADVREEPGALPLLQYALTEVFQRRDGIRLTLGAYQDSGGVLGALARRAEEVYIELEQSQQAIVRQVFLRMITLGEGTEDTRRRARRGELADIVPDNDQLQFVLDAFGQFRLLTFDVDPNTREPMIEVAHEALIREWDQLRGWLDNSRSDVRLQRVLAGESAEWQKSGRDASFLLSGARLIQYEEWVATTDLALTSDERAYLEASIEERRRLDIEEQARKAREEETARRAEQFAARSRQLTRAATALGVVFVLAVIATFILISQVASTQTQVAEGQTQIAGVVPTIDAAETQVAAVEPTLIAADAQIALAVGQVAEAETQVAEFQPTVDNAQTQIAAVEPTLAAAEAQIAAIVPTLDAAQTQVAGVEPTLDAANLRVEGAETQVASADIQVAQAETSVAIFEPTVIAAETQIAGVAPTLDAAEAQIAAIVPTLDAAQTQVAGVEPTLAAANLRVEGAETQVASADIQIAQAETAVAIFEPTVIAAETQIAGVQPTVAAAEAQIAALVPTLDSAQTQVAGVEPTLAAANLRVEGAETQVAAVGPTIDAAETQIAGVVPTLSAAETQIAGVEPTLLAVQAQVSDQQAIANALRLVRNAEQLLATDNPDLAIALILEAYRLNPNLGETQRLLSESIPLTVRLDLQTQQNQALFSPDERFLAVISGFSINIWDPQARIMLNSLAASANVRIMVFSPDGQRIAGGLSNGVIQVWDAGTGQLLRNLRGHRSAVLALAYHPTEQRLISGGQDRTAILWDIDNERIIQQIGEGHEESVTRVAFNDNGTEAYSYDFSRPRPRVGVFRLGVEPFYRTPPEYRGLSENGNTAYTGADGSGFLTFWNANTGVRLRFFQRGNAGSDYIDEIAFSPDGLSILVHVEGRAYSRPNEYRVTGRHVAIWSIISGEEVLRLPFNIEDPTGWDVSSLAWSHDSRLVMVGARVGSVHIASVWNAVTGTEVNRFRGHVAPITNVQFSGDLSYALSVSSDDNVRVWDIGREEPNIVQRWNIRVNTINSFGLSDDGSLAYLAYDDQSIGTWDLINDREIPGRRFFTGARRIIEFSPVAPLALAVTDDGVVLWDMQTSQRRYRIDEIQPRDVRSIAFSWDNKSIFIGTASQIFHWDIEAGSILRRINVGANHLAVSRNNEFILAAQDRAVTVIDLIVNQRTSITATTNRNSLVTSVDFSPMGTTIAIGLSDPENSVLLFERNTDSLVYTMIGHRAAINIVKYSSDGRNILSGSDDGTLILWDVQSGQIIRQYSGHSAPVEQVIFSPAGRLAISRSSITNDGLIGWQVETAQETVNRTYASRYVPRITCQQRVQYNVEPQCVDNVIPPPLPTPTPQATATIIPSPTPRPTLTPTSTPIPTGVIRTEGNVTANLRSGPGPGFSLVTQVASGTRVEIIELRADIGWINVRLPDGTSGWLLQGIVR